MSSSHLPFLHTIAERNRDIEKSIETSLEQSLAKSIEDSIEKSLEKALDQSIQETLEKSFVASMTQPKDAEDTTTHVSSKPHVTIPDTPGNDAAAQQQQPPPEEGGEFDHSLTPECYPGWALALSNAALTAVDYIQRRRDVTRVSVEHNLCVKDGSIKRRVEIDLMCATEETSRMTFHE